MRLPALSDRNWPFAVAVCTFPVALSAPPLRSLIEQSMLWHMVIQMPMLVLGGWLAMGAIRNTALPAAMAAWNRYGLTGFIAAQAVTAYWMLPLAIDRAVVLPAADGAKLVTLLACGALLRHSVDRAPAVLQLFFIGYAVPMMIWLGLYFASVDLRLCNAYSLESQVRAGHGLAALALVLGTLWLVQMLRRGMGFARTRPASPRNWNQTP
jgi:hypothetical protein